MPRAENPAIDQGTASTCAITSQPEQSKRQDKLECSPQLEQPQSSSIPAQIIQPEAKSQLESPQKPPSVANPTERFKQQLKQQPPTKTQSVQGFQQQQRPPDLQKKLPTPSTHHSPQPSKQQRFRVNVNGRFFEGFFSVTLNKRVVLIDGVNVGQAKMVIVLGQAKTVQADGGVSQGGNQVVLTSR